MYQPPLFQEVRADVLHALIARYPLATLVSAVGGTLSADHLPLILHPDLSENGTLRSHIAIENPLGRDTETAIDVLAVFQGPQAYVTPSWYPSKSEHGKVVPTWNYAVVHAHGTLRFYSDPDKLRAHLSELTAHNEKSRAKPWAVADAPADYVARQMKGIIGFAIEIKTLVGKWKVSQNKAEQDRDGVEKGLLAEGTAQADAVAGLVGRRDRQGTPKSDVAKSDVAILGRFVNNLVTVLDLWSVSGH